MDEPQVSSISRRDLLKLGGAAVAAGSGLPLLDPKPATAQTPKRGGTFRLRIHVAPVHFDPQQTVAFPTMQAMSFTHSRLVKVKAGSSVKPGTQPLEADLAESWTQPNDTTYIFKLRRGARWHAKPPVNGREVTAVDVKYSYERFLLPANPNRGLLEQVDKIEAVDRHTVKFTLKEPFAWFLDSLASPSTWIIAKEAVDQYGDLKRPESCVGTGPWMLERYEPNVRCTWVRNPNYFIPGLPYVDNVEVSIETDPATALAVWLSGRYDFAPEYGMVVRRSDLEAAIPAAFKDWSLPIDQLPPESRRLSRARASQSILSRWRLSVGSMRTRTARRCCWIRLTSTWEPCTRRCLRLQPMRAGAPSRDFASIQATSPNWVAGVCAFSKRTDCRACAPI